MKFIVSLSDIQATLLKVIPAIPRKSTLPVLEHLHFKLNGPTLEIIATDQDITIKTIMHVIGEEDGEILVPGRKLNDIIRAIDTGGDVLFNSDIETYEVTLSTNSGRFKMKGLNSNEYLDIPELFRQPEPELNDSIPEKPININRDAMMRIANHTVFAVSNDEFRPAMNGVFFYFANESLTAVATDSFRLVRVILPASEGSDFPEDLSLIIPARSMDVLKKIDNDVEMSVLGNAEKITHVRFNIGETIFITRVIDEKFPPYEAVIPDEMTSFAVFPQKDFHSALKRVSLFSNEDSHQVRITIEDNMLYMHGEDEESGGSGNETVQCEYQGEQFRIAFNIRYLEEAIANIQSDQENQQLKMSMIDATKPALIEPVKMDNDILMLVMPIRL